jgi:hypothetical protein
MKEVKVFEDNEGNLHRSKEFARKADINKAIRSTLCLSNFGISDELQIDIVNRIMQYPSTITGYLEEIRDGVIRG